MAFLCINNVGTVGLAPAVPKKNKEILLQPCFVVGEEESKKVIDITHVERSRMVEVA